MWLVGILKRCTQLIEDEHDRDWWKRHKHCIKMSWTEPNLFSNSVTRRKSAATCSSWERFVRSTLLSAAVFGLWWLQQQQQQQHTHTHTHTNLTALCPGLPRSAGTREVKPIWILLKQRDGEWQWNQLGLWNSAPISRQITMPAPHHSVFYRPDTLPATKPTASKHWTHTHTHTPV